MTGGRWPAVADTVLFDLGNTLVRYWPRDEFPGILRQAIGAVQEELERQGLLRVSPQEVWQRVRAEDHESRDHRVRPLEGRLARIFRLEAAPPSIVEVLCDHFLAPMLGRGAVYPETIPVLQSLRGQGIQTAIVSNTPWGSPARSWRAEIDSLGLGQWVAVTVFCRDAGWRKPAAPIFDLALEKLGAEASRCLFVGDDPRWDLAGAQAAGMAAVLVQRPGGGTAPGAASIPDLYGVLDRLEI